MTVSTLLYIQRSIPQYILYIPKYILQYNLYIPQYILQYNLQSACKAASSWPDVGLT